MSQIRVNNITNRTGIAGPTVAGIASVNSSSHFVVPTGRTGQRYADEGENIVREGLVLYLDAKYSYPGTNGIGITATNPDVYTVYDLSGYENQGELIGGVAYSPLNQGTFSFDGVNDYIKIDKRQVFNTNNYTVSMWVYITKTTTYGVYFTKGYSDTYLTDLQLWDDYGFRLYSGNNTPSLTQFGIGAQNKDSMINQWRNLVVTNNNNQYTMYFDAALYSSGTYISPIQDRNIYIGGPPEGGYFSAYFGGRIGTIMYHNRALSATEVLQNYNAHKPRFT